MRRACLKIGICSIALVLSAGVSSAQETGSGILFTGCPPYVQGNHCDSMFYQVVAVDLSTGKQCPEMKYILVSGPGEINQKTGLWQFHPERENLSPRYYDSVEIAAHKGNDTTTSDENCRFSISVKDQPPSLEDGCYRHLDLTVGDSLVVPLTLIDEDKCDEPRIDSVYVSPIPSGFFAYDPVGQIVTFVPDAADAGLQFVVSMLLSSGQATRQCRFFVNVTALPPTYVVRTGFLDDQIQGQYCEVPITLEKFDPQWGIGGFDFLIGYDASALAFQLAIEGDLYDSCAWEYFTYRYGAEGNCGASCPSGMLRIIGVAETNNGATHPNLACTMTNPGWVDSVPTTLAQMRFLISNDRTLEGAFIPIRFFWYNCGDNVVSSTSGERAFLSHDVYDLGYGGVITGVEPFPTYRGTQDECVIDDPNTNKYALRAVDFHNGGIQIIRADSLNGIGDINLNGMPYEIADAVMFSNYFVHGLAAFGSHVDGSVAASDVTKDGLTLTIADLVYMIDVIIGDALPYRQLTPSPNVAAFVWNQSINNVVSFSTPDTLGAVCLVAEGEFTPYLLAGQMEMKYAVDSGLTRILVWSLEGHAITSGNVLAIPGATGIVSIETATYYARAVATSLEITNPDTTVAYTVRLGSREDQIQGQYCDIPIILEKFDSTQGLGGFDFLLGYNASNLAFQLAHEGDLYDECAWEYFTYRYGTEGTCDTNCPSGMLRILGLAETNNGDIHPGCASNNAGYVASVPVTLVNLRFLISNDVELGDTWLPIRFFWTDCGNNVLSTFDGSDLYLSSSVFDVGEQLISGTEAFPTYKGAQDECLYDVPGDGRCAVRGVDFFNGGLAIRGYDTVDCRGDINRNNVAFEIADSYMFANYFVNGLSAFGADVAQSVINSDVDGDGNPLEIQDLVFLSRVVMGASNPEDYPLQTPSSNTAYFMIDPEYGAVWMATPDSIGAIHFTVGGQVEPVVMPGQASLSYQFVDGVTNILLWGLGSSFGEGPLITIPGAVEILTVEAATYDARPVHTAFDPTSVGPGEDAMPMQFALHGNYPNPFNPATTIAYDLPEKADVSITIYNVVGQTVRTLVNQAESAGRHEVAWDGRDDSGRPVSSGLYLYRMTAGDFTQSRKMMFLK